MPKSITGVVSSNKTDKTIVITVREKKTHPLYRKQYTTSKKFMAHDENNEAQVGDTVVVVETRPISRRKHFTLQSIVEKAEVKHIETAVQVPGVTDKPASVKGEEK
ncbi:30S ribosomal protein S17 [Candidatus Saccharibacteria bacterium]|nr:MAG: 30S ribosomal protein S17 [Candidatus Saccharibacteria bacterium]